MSDQDRSPKALGRAIKKDLYATEQEVHIRFPRHLGDVCAAEVTALLSSSLLPKKFAPEIDLQETAIVVSKLGVRQLFELPLRLRTAHEILWVLRQTRAGSMGDLKAELAKVDWPLFFAPGTKVAVKLEATASKVFHETAAIKAAHGVLKKFDLQAASRDEADQLIEIKLKRNQLTISISLANGALFKRGYKQALKAVASLREDLAANATKLCFHWLEEAWGESLLAPDLIYVPFAGSGTLGFEAVLGWFDLAPAAWQNLFACESLVCAPKDSLLALRKKLLPTVKLPTTLTFVEKDRTQVAALKADIDSFCEGFASTKSPVCEVIEADVFAQQAPHAEHIFLPLNPPYGLRLKEGGPVIYQKLGTWLTQLAKGTKGAVSGYVFIPDDATRKAFQKTIKGYNISSQTVSSGGKKLTLALFRSQ